VKTSIKRAAVAGIAALALAAFGTACEGTSTGKSSSKTSASESKGKGASTKSTVEQFRAFVKKNGTDGEKTAVTKVTKVQGADKNNDILDAPEIHTSIKGDMMDSDATGAAKLLASAFADFQADRGMSSKNGLVTVYNASGDMIGNGKF
jgi:hypothetical protein